MKLSPVTGIWQVVQDQITRILRVLSFLVLIFAKVSSCMDDLLTDFYLPLLSLIVL